MNFNLLGGRKFIITMLIGATTALLTFLGKIDGNTYSITIIGTVGAYIAGNTLQKARNNDVKPELLP